MTTPLSLWLAVLLGAAPLTQADPEEPQPTPTPVTFQTEVLVTAERGEEQRGRTPAATVLLQEEQIQRLPAANLGELLAFVPGFHSVLGASFAGRPLVTSRGFSGVGLAEYVQLLVDGVPVADVESGLVDWQGLSVSNVRRVEALRGPGSSLYGDTAIGGVIQVFTDASSGNGARLAASGGSFGSLALEGGLQRSSGAARFGLDAGLEQTDGAREHARFEEGRFSLFAEHVGDSSVLRLDAAGQARDRDDPGPLPLEAFEADPGASAPEYRFDEERRRALRGALSYRRTLERGLVSARLHAAGRDGRVVSTLLLAPGLPDSVRRRLDTTSVGFRLDAEHRFSLAGRNSELRAGLDLGREGIDTDYSQVSPAGEVGDAVSRAEAVRRRLALFAAQGWDLAPRVRLVAGLRWDRIEDRPTDPSTAASVHQAWSPRVGLNVRLGSLARNPVVLFVQLARAFKTPTLDQLFDPRPYPDFQGGTLLISNPDLKPQRARNYELGLSGGSKRHRWQALAYLMDVDDEIDFDEATFQYENIARSRHTGVELEARLFADGVVSPALSYAWSHAAPREPGQTDLQLSNVPQHVLRPSLSVKLARGASLELRYQLLAGRYLDDENRVPVSDASTLDVRVEGSRGRVRGWLDLLNLTNTTAAAHGFVLPDFFSGEEVGYVYPMPGFALRAGLSVAF